MIFVRRDFRKLEGNWEGVLRIIEKEREREKKEIKEINTMNNGKFHSFMICFNIGVS